MFKSHALIEGMIIAGYAMGAKASRQLHPHRSSKVINGFSSVLVTRAAGFLGKNILGSILNLNLCPPRLRRIYLR